MNNNNNVNNTNNINNVNNMNNVNNVNNMNNTNNFQTNELLVYNNHTQNNFNSKKTNYPEKSIFLCIISIVISIIVFSIAIYIFGGLLSGIIFYIVTRSQNINSFFRITSFSEAELYVSSSYTNIIINLIVYVILLLLFSIFSIKDCFRKKRLNSKNIKIFKIIASIIYILWFGFFFWVNYTSLNVSLSEVDKYLIENKDYLTFYIGEEGLNLFDKLNALPPLVIIVYIIGTILAVLSVNKIIKNKHQNK